MQNAKGRHRPWLDHYDYWVPHHTNYPRRPLYEILRRAAAELAKHFDILEIDGCRTFTYETCYFDDADRNTCSLCAFIVDTSQREAHPSSPW